MYVPTGTDLGDADMYISYYDSGAWTDVVLDISTADAWKSISTSIDLPSTTTGFRMYPFIDTTADNNDVFYLDDIRLTTHNVPGTHFLSSGYIENLLTLPDKFTIQIKFLATFAFDIGSDQHLWGYVVSGTQRCRIMYQVATDAFQVAWQDGGTVRTLVSAQYDDGSAERNISQYITLTLAFDSTTGDTTGSALWMDKTQDTTAWSGAIDAHTTVFNKMQTRAQNGIAGAFDIAYVRFFSGLVATNAQVQNDFKDVQNEEIFWSLDGHGTGHTRVNISNSTAKTLQHYDIYKGITSKFNGTFGTNVLKFRLRNDNGEFSDDQNAAWDPIQSVYNGTNAQNYLQNRFGIMLESWYSGDFDFLFVGRATEDGFRRQSMTSAISMVTCSAEDGVGDLDRSFEEFGRIFTSNMLTRQHSLMDRGGCEAVLNPAMFDELTVTLSNATLERQSAEVYHGRFARVGTKTIAAGTAATITLADSIAGGDMHGMVAAATYTIRAKLKLPSGAMLGSEWVLAIVDSAGSTTQAATNTYDLWQVVTVTRTLDAGATYAYPQIQINANAANNELFYIDIIEFDPLDASEAHDNSLFHLIARRGYRRQIQFLSNTSFENATITDSWLASGGTWTKDATDWLFGSASGKLVPGGSTEFVLQFVLFTGTKKLNVGETYNFSIWLKSTAAASGADNAIYLQEGDVDDVNVTTSVAYSLAGGEGYVKVEAPHTITDSDSDRLRVIVSAAAGDTINMDGAMLIQADRALEYFEENTLDGTGGDSLADNAQEISWPWFGIHTGDVDYIHPWRRMEMNTTVWQNAKSVGAGTMARYCGFDENNTLLNRSILDNDFGDLVPAGIVTDNSSDLNYVLLNQLSVRLDALTANRLVLLGNRFELGTVERLIWLASATGNFTESTADQQLAEVVANGAFWPNPADYAEYWAEYGVNPDGYGITTRLTAIPLTMWPSGYFAVDVSGIPPDLLLAQWRHIVGADLSKVPTSKRDRIVGIQDAALIHKTEATGDGDGPFTYVTAGRLVAGLDIQTKAGQAQILLLNEGAQDTLIDAGIVGKPVYKFSGKEGYIHDSHIDRADIAKNGERLIQFGGEDFIDGTPNGQLDRAADFVWKDRSTRKHIYIIGSIGAAHDLSPADWMNIDIGATGETENILGVAEITGVRITAEHDRRGLTQVTYREVEEAWKYDSSAPARFLARGVPVSNPGGGGAFVTIGSEFYHGASDVRIAKGDTSAETTIKAAIDFASSAYGGGTVHLSKGVFNIDGPILLNSNVRLEGEGAQTIIKTSGAITGAIRGDGAGGSELSNVIIANLQIQNGDNGSGTYAIFFDFVDDSIIENIWITESAGWGLVLTQCDRLTVSNINITKCSERGFSITSCRTLALNNILIDGAGAAGDTQYGILIIGAGNRATLNNISITNLSSSGAVYLSGITITVTNTLLANINIGGLMHNTEGEFTRGLYIISNGLAVSNVNISDCDAATAANGYGIYIIANNCTLSSIYVTGCSGVGLYIHADADRTEIAAGRATNNGTDFTDDGTNTTARVEDT